MKLEVYAVECKLLIAAILKMKMKPAPAMVCDR